MWRSIRENLRNFFLFTTGRNTQFLPAVASGALTGDHTVGCSSPKPPCITASSGLTATQSSSELVTYRWQRGFGSRRPRFILVRRSCGHNRPTTNPHVVGRFFYVYYNGVVDCIHIAKNADQEQYRVTPKSTGITHALCFSCYGIYKTNPRKNPWESVGYNIYRSSKPGLPKDQWTKINDTNPTYR